MLLLSKLSELFGGLWQLLRLLILSRFRLSGPYWQWRLHTAFGRGYPKSRAELIRAAVDYGRWMHRMRSL